MREEKKEGGKKEKREKVGGRRDRGTERQREGEAKGDRRRDDHKTPTGGARPAGQPAEAGASSIASLIVQTDVINGRDQRDVINWT